MIKGSEIRRADHYIERIFVDHWTPRAISGCIGDLPEQLQARETPSDRKPMLQSLCEGPFSP
ncbi:MAG: hypothetical protein H7Y05_08005 [Steroidobacteraceae bacterium]|nr:hypothetical protein [Deltaproteobacteria bacterium]